MELRLLRRTVHFFLLRLAEILRINFNHFEKLIIIVVKHLYSLAFTFRVKQQSNFVFFVQWPQDEAYESLRF